MQEDKTVNKYQWKRKGSCCASMLLLLWSWHFC